MASPTYAPTRYGYRLDREFKPATAMNLILDGAPEATLRLGFSPSY